MEMLSHMTIYLFAPAQTLLFSHLCARCVTRRVFVIMADIVHAVVHSMAVQYARVLNTVAVFSYGHAAD